MTILAIATVLLFVAAAAGWRLACMGRRGEALALLFAASVTWAGVVGHVLR